MLQTTYNSERFLSFKRKEEKKKERKIPNNHTFRHKPRKNISFLVNFLQLPLPKKFAKNPKSNERFI